MYLGIEIGGTKLQFGVGTGDSAELAALERRTVAPDRGAEGIREQIREAGGLLLSRHRVERVGIGFGGPVRAAEGRVLKSHQVEGWDEFPLAAWCRETFGAPCVLGNDCDVAALAESRHGAGRGHRVVFYVTVGTGVGGGLVVDGRIFGADRPAVAEIGHLRPGLIADAHGDVESLASGRGIEQAVRRRLADVASALHSRPKVAALLQGCGGDPLRLTARQIAEAAAGGNPLAREAFQDACDVLGWAVAQAVTLIAPEVVVVGGGVSLAGESLFFGPLREAVRRYVFPPLAGSYRIAPAALGETVVVHGAIALAAQ